ncbi:MAG: DUF3284 domain-containing protein [Erysipelothrix sp.]|jgi:hypothetical protein|nr:DUF3284 domain-containing protein [Erysipelothrix sp.]
MPHQTLLFSISSQTLYNYLVDMLCTTFKCAKEDLQKETFETTMNQHNKTFKVIQRITTLTPYQKIALESTINEDSILTIYSIESVSETDCKVTMIEHATSKSVGRRLNYALLSLPILNFLSKSRIKARLYAMKHQFER